MSDVRLDAAQHRYVLTIDGETAVAAFGRRGDVLVFTHTLVPKTLRGQGVGSALVAGALADVRRQGLRIVPQCPFAADYIARHPDQRDIVAS